MEETRLAMKSFIMLFCMVVPFTTGNHDVISTSTSSSLITTTGPANESDRMILEIRQNLTIRMTFKEELENSSSAEYLQLARKTRSTLTDVFDGLNGFSTVVVNRFREGSVVVDYDLQFNGDTNLTVLVDDFAQRLERLEQATVDGSNIKPDAFTMNAQFKKAAFLQLTGNVCDIAKCQYGYVCRYGYWLCLHVCSFYDDICRDRGGCLYDPDRDETFCRCGKDEVFLENVCRAQSSRLAGTFVGVIGLASVVINIKKLT